MRVPGIIYASEQMLPHINEERVLGQVANVACLPGVTGCSLAMPDVHWGYGFPIGGVAAMRLDDGVVSPGGVGFDINCGVRLLTTCLDSADLQPRIEALVNELYTAIPSGLGVSGKIHLNTREINSVLEGGSRWAVEHGFGKPEDLACTEETGWFTGSSAGCVSNLAKERGASQLGTLGSGNHFVEIAAVDEIYAPDTARVMGIERPGQVVAWIHTGSRGLGHQVADDYIKTMLGAMAKYGITVPDRQLACCPVNSSEGKDYLAAIRCAANYAWANRQMITHLTREAFAKVMGATLNSLGLELLWDVAHNIAKLETHIWEGQRIQLCVHRKGATRAFPAHHPDLPARYASTGQPVLIPGDMGRYSFVMVGTQRAMEESFGSTCHGAGRLKSRIAARKTIDGRDFAALLARRGIVVRAGSISGLAEEASGAYKDISEVIEVAHGAGLSDKVLRTRPLGVIKG
ncbi:MAG: RtcB family protein [Dehalococcoidaceae bacterium]|nr:RtcB family protein [Dehalococcoidaceae bacterium]